MSEAHNEHDEHQSVIRTPKQLVAAVAAGFIVPIVCIVLLVQFVTTDKKVGAGSNAQTPEAIAVRLQPVSDIGFSFKDASGPKALMTGEAVYSSTCTGCHAAGAAGSPKFADAGAWGPRISQGFDTLLDHALHGFKGMPAKGGNAELKDVEVARAVVYMANKGGASFKEPAVPAEAPAAGGDAAAAPAAK